MQLGLVAGAKRGQHYELAMFALSKLKKLDLLVKGQSEKLFEYSIVSRLQASPKLRPHLKNQIGLNKDVKITKADLFGFKHRPDASIDEDGTAIEIKIIKTGQSIRDILGQAIAYRMYYRFVILVLVDQTEGRKIVELCRSRDSQECSLLSGLAGTMIYLP